MDGSTTTSGADGRARGDDASEEAPEALFKLTRPLAQTPAQPATVACRSSTACRPRSTAWRCRPSSSSKASRRSPASTAAAASSASRITATARARARSTRRRRPSCCTGACRARALVSTDPATGSCAAVEAYAVAIERGEWFARFRRRSTPRPKPCKRASPARCAFDCSRAIAASLRHETDSTLNALNSELLTAKCHSTCGPAGSTPPPIRRRSISACRSPSIAACSKTTSTGSLAWADALERAGVLDAGRRARIAGGAQRDPRAGAARSRLGQRRRRGRAQLRRAPAGGAHRRRRPAPAHRPFAQRAGVGGLAALPAPPHSAAAAAAARGDRRAGRSGRTGRRRADAVLHAHAPRDAGAGLALPAEPRRGAAPRSRAARPCARRGRCAAARLGRDCRHRLCGRHRRAGHARSASRAWSPTAWTPRRIATSPSASCTPSSLAMVHLSPHRRGLDPVHRRGVRVLRAGRFVGHRQQHDAAEEESRSARARARQGRPRDRPPHRPARDDEGPADRLQQGSAGGQGAALRRRGHAGGLAATPPPPWSRKLTLRPERTGGPRRACCWRPTSPTTWWRAACRSARPTKWSARMVRRLLAEGRDFETLSLAEWRESSALFGDDVQATVTAAASVRARTTPQSTNPDAVGAAWPRRGRGLPPERRFDKFRLPCAFRSTDRSGASRPLHECLGPFAERLRPMDCSSTLVTTVPARPWRALRGEQGESSAAPLSRPCTTVSPVVEFSASPSYSLIFWGVACKTAGSGRVTCWTITVHASAALPTMPSWR